MDQGQHLRRKVHQNSYILHYAHKFLRLKQSLYLLICLKNATHVTKKGCHFDPKPGFKLEYKVSLRQIGTRPISLSALLCYTALKLTCLASIEFHSHGDMSVPRSRMYADKARIYWWREGVQFDAVLIIIASEILKIGN